MALSMMAMLGMGLLAVAVWLLMPGFVSGQEVALAVAAPTLAPFVVTATPAATVPVVAPLVVVEPPTATSSPTVMPSATPLPPATPTATIVIVQPPPVTDTPSVPPTWTPAPTAAFVSGGLGQPEAWWVQQYGQGVSEMVYERYGQFRVAFMDGKAMSVEQQFIKNMAPADVELIVPALIPADSTLITTYAPLDRPEAVVHLYSSPSLAQQFTRDVWYNASPGQFIVLYHAFAEGVPSVIVATGNNP